MTADADHMSIEAPKTVPVVIYIGNERRVVGTATVVGDKITAQISDADGEPLASLITRNQITGISVRFNTPLSFRGNYPAAKEIAVVHKEDSQ